MAFIEENDALVPTPTSSRAPGWSATSPDRYVSPAVQAQRDADAGRLLVAEYPSVEAARASSAALRRELPKVKGDARGMLSGHLERLDRGLAESPVTPIAAAPRTVKPAEQASQSGFITEGEALGSFISEEEATGIRPKTSTWERVKEDVGAMLGIKGPVTAGSIAQRGYDWLTKPTLDESNSSVFERGQKMTPPTKAEYAAAAPIRERIGALPKPTLQSDRPTGAQVIARGAAGVVPQLSDMLTSTGKQVLTLPIYAAGYAYQRSQGVDSPTAAKLAMQNKDKLLPDTIFAPWRTIAENLGGEVKAAYEKNPVAWVMGQIGEVVTSGGEAAASKLNVPPEHFAAITDEVMGLMGVHAFKPAVAKAIAARLEQMTGVTGRPGTGGFGDFAEAPRERVTPDMSAPQVKAIVDSALAGRGPLETIWPPEPPKVKTKAAKVTPMTEMARTLTEESPYVEPPKASRVPGEAGPEPVQGPPAPERPAIPPRERPILLAALEKQQEGLLIDAQEARVLRQSGLDAKTTAPLVTQALDQLREGKLISQEQAKALRTLKVDVERGVVKGPNGQTLFERGKADPALLGVLSVLGLGAAMAPQLVDWWNNSGGLSGDNSTGLALAGAGAAGAMKGKVFLEKNPGFADTVLKTPQGELAALYHGGKALESGMPSQGSGRFGEGTYFTDSAKRASGFGKDGAVYPAHVNLKNPISADAFAERYGMGIKTSSEARRITKELQAEGYDGVVDKLGDRYTEVVAFEPEAQVRSAISGNADPKLLAGIAAGTAAALYLANNPINDFTKAALTLGGSVGVTKGRFADMPLPEVIKAYRESTGRSKELAAAKIYEDTHRQLTRSVQQMVKDQNLPVEDIVQETYMSAFKALDAGAYDGTRAALPTFLHAIAKNELRQMYRRPVEQTARRTGSLEVDPETQAAVVPEKYLMEQNPERYKSAYDEAAQSDLGREMIRAIEKLPEHQRAVVHAVELEGLSYAEAGELLGIPENTVRSQLSRAKESMRQTLSIYSDRQAGKVNLELLLGLGGVAGGAALVSALSSDAPTRNIVYGALAGGVLATSAGRAALKKVIKSPDFALGVVSTRMGNIAPELKFKQRRHEYTVLKEIDKANDAVLPFIQALDKLPSQLKPEANRAILNGAPEGLANYPGLATTYPAVQKLLSHIETELKALGRFAEGVVNYFPRIIKDFDGLKAALGQAAAEGLEKRLVEAEAKKLRKSGEGLTEVERSIVANQYLFAPDQTSFQPGFAKARGVREIPEHLLPFYELPTETLLRYVSAATNDIATAKFFGKDLKTKGKGGKVFNDVDSSIGNVTQRLLQEGKMTQKQSMEYREMLKARFNGGEQGMNPALAATRNITNAALLGNVTATATQLGDSLMVLRHAGFVPTLKSLVEHVIGHDRVTPKDLGIVNHVAEELASQGLTGALLQTTMKYSGFQKLDLFAKGLLSNALLAKNEALVKTVKGEQQFRAKYQGAFDNIDQVISDLKNRRRTEDTDFLAFNDISDYQPISKAEMTEAYLAHPNGRMLFQLKTYLVKQLDIVRRESYQEIATKTPSGVARGLKNLATLAAAYSVASIPGDAIKDWLSGRDVDLFKTPDLLDNVLKTFGFNRYAMDKISQGKVVETVENMITPPVSVIEDIAKLDTGSIRYIPGGGKPVSDRFFGGNEMREISEARRANRKAKKEGGPKTPLSPAAKQYLREKRLEKKRKELEEKYK